MRDRKDAKIHINVINTQLAGQNQVELRVVDNGPGIPDNMIDNLFEPYTTTKSKGGGLGLAVVKRIVEEHSGTVFAENQHEGGACIVVRIPVSSNDSGNGDTNLRVHA